MITVAYTLGIWALSMAVPQIYIYLFSSGEAARQLSVLGRPMIRIFMGGFLFIGAQYACQNTFMALGRAKISLVMALLRKIILLIPLALFLPLFLALRESSRQNRLQIFWPLPSPPEFSILCQKNCSYMLLMILNRGILQRRK